MLLVRLPVNDRLLVAKILGSQKLHTDFRVDPLPPVLFRGQLYTQA